jgi:hypothetical protein
MNTTPMVPTYYVGRPDGSFSAASPQPVLIGAPEEGAAFEWIYTSLMDKGETRMAEAVHFLIGTRKIALEDARFQSARMPVGWVPLTITHHGDGPEEVAYGPKIMMDRLAQWLDRYFVQIIASRAQAARKPEPTRWHDLKSDPDVFAAVMDGRKTNEIRANDRDFQVGDGLVLRETRHAGQAMREGMPLEYTGRVCRRVVTHVQTGYGLPDGLAVLSLDQVRSCVHPSWSVDEDGACTVCGSADHAAVVPAQSVADQALAALRENHQHHQDHDDHDGYPGSDLEATNLAAIAALEARPATQHPDNVTVKSAAGDQWSVDPKWAPALQAVLDGKPATSLAKAIHVEAVAEVGRIDHDDGSDEPTLDWLIEGGIYALPAGSILLCADTPITDDTGRGDVYTSPQALSHAHIEPTKEQEKALRDATLYGTGVLVDGKHMPLNEVTIAWPKARDVGRLGDMSPTGHIRVGLDSDNDVYVSLWDTDGGASVEFCNGVNGGGKSPRTRAALIALMVAMEADNAECPSRDWWAQRGAPKTQEGGAA